MKRLHCCRGECGNEAKFVVIYNDGLPLRPGRAWMLCTKCVYDFGDNVSHVQIRTSDGSLLDYMPDKGPGEIARMQKPHGVVTSVPAYAEPRKIVSPCGAHKDVIRLTRELACEITLHSEAILEDIIWMNLGEKLGNVVANYKGFHCKTTWGQPRWLTREEERSLHKQLNDKSEDTSRPCDSHRIPWEWHRGDEKLSHAELFEHVHGTGTCDARSHLPIREFSQDYYELFLRLHLVFLTVGAPAVLADGDIAWQLRDLGFPKASEPLDDWFDKSDHELVWIAREHVGLYKAWELRMRRCLILAGFEESKANQKYRELTHVFFNCCDHCVRGNYGDSALIAWAKKYVEPMSKVAAYDYATSVARVKGGTVASPNGGIALEVDEGDLEKALFS